ncbi:tethering factor for nuclear proteasome STS1-like [Gigantopelta aegis]|uniref:tethering factor for nuclear proteasome STS1-like n=1 Tax=Gigantopelta aegis TaxID=1735272 RepID=UPI001B887779|nr:tethering factor for nuclear proteasome STS1-like [Gigantopelta aegis]XP_041373638.1 tethering factor for nuclear proteasome STS1-like [Gigantopelta aegis]XP_041373639.1 tethering factor for nuclear proteasome STS1-like [Gigantopelta aegis]
MPQRREPLKSLPVAAASRNGSQRDLMSMWHMTPRQSPEEEIIEQRSRRSSPRKSPKKSYIETIDITNLDSSMESNLSMADTDTPLRTKVPRAVKKKLLMSKDDEEKTPFPKNLSPPTKKRKTSSKKKMAVSNDSRVTPDDLSRRLSSLSNQQLVDIITGLAGNQPDLQQDIEELIPAPDITPLVENLNFFRKNILKAVPYSRYGTNTDAFCFRRCKTHVMSFKEACVSQGKQLQEAGSWCALCEYVKQAWSEVGELPDWDNENHCSAKRLCFKSLAAMFKHVIKNGTFSREEYSEMKEWLAPKVDFHEELSPCTTLLDKKIAKCH